MNTEEMGWILPDKLESRALQRGHRHGLEQLDGAVPIEAEHDDRAVAMR